MGGHISGAHYNPAGSLACMIRGAISVKETCLYMLSQILGGLVGAAISGYLATKSITVAPGEGITIVQALLVEALFTFALASMVLNVATSKDHQNNSFYGLAIGFTVLVAAFAGGPISGGRTWPQYSLRFSWHNLDIPCWSFYRWNPSSCCLPDYKSA